MNIIASLKKIRYKAQYRRELMGTAQTFTHSIIYYGVRPEDFGPRLREKMDKKFVETGKLTTAECDEIVVKMNNRLVRKM